MYYLLLCSFLSDALSTLDIMAADHLLMLNRACNDTYKLRLERVRLAILAMEK